MSGSERLFSRDASERLVFSDSRIPAVDYARVRDGLVKGFNLMPKGAQSSNGYDVFSRDYEEGGRTVSIEWDNWMGFMLVAKDSSAEELVHIMADSSEFLK